MNSLKQKIILVISGIVLCLAILEIGLRIAGSFYLFMQEQRNRISPGQDGAYRIICIGESTTALGGNNSYPSQLEKILNQRLAPMKFKVINKGLPGVDTNAILSQVGYYLKVYKPDMVIAMMGINDDANPYPKSRERFSGIKRFIKTLRIYKFVKLLSLRLQGANVLKDLCLKQGQYYLEIERYSEAEEMFNKAKEAVPSDAYAYIGLGRVYEKQDKLSLAGGMFKKAQELAPGNAQVYLEMASVYSDKPVLAEKMLKKAIELDPKYYQAYCDLAQVYQDTLRLKEAEGMFKQAQAAAPESMEPYLLLGWFYYEHGRPVEAEVMFAKAIEKDREDLITYRELGYVKQSQGKHKEAQFYFEMSKPLTEYVKGITRNNYRALKDIVLKRGIKLACVQYPMRSVSDLKESVHSEDDIVFVDNETVFRDAVKDGKYEDIFKDRFGGNFGHCTPLGNRLLANNIAEALIREIFSKER